MFNYFIVYTYGFFEIENLVEDEILSQNKLQLSDIVNLKEKIKELNNQKYDYMKLFRKNFYFVFKKIIFLNKSIED